MHPAGKLEQMNYDESNEIATLGHKMSLHLVFEVYPGFLMGSKVKISALCSWLSLLNFALGPVVPT